MLPRQKSNIGAVLLQIISETSVHYTALLLAVESVANILVTIFQWHKLRVQFHYIKMLLHTGTIPQLLYSFTISHFCFIPAQSLNYCTVLLYHTAPSYRHNPSTIVQFQYITMLRHTGTIPQLLYSFTISQCRFIPAQSLNYCTVSLYHTAPSYRHNLSTIV